MMHKLFLPILIIRLSLQNTPTPSQIQLFQPNNQLFPIDFSQQQYQSLFYQFYPTKFEPFSLQFKPNQDLNTEGLKIGYILSPQQDSQVPQQSLQDYSALQQGQDQTSKIIQIQDKNSIPQQCTATCYFLIKITYQSNNTPQQYPKLWVLQSLKSVYQNLDIGEISPVPLSPQYPQITISQSFNQQNLYDNLIITSQSFIPTNLIYTLNIGNQAIDPILISAENTTDITQIIIQKSKEEIKTYCGDQNQCPISLQIKPQNPQQLTKLYQRALDIAILSNKKIQEKMIQEWGPITLKSIPINLLAHLPQNYINLRGGNLFPIKIHQKKGEQNLIQGQSNLLQGNVYILLQTSTSKFPAPSSNELLPVNGLEYQNSLVLSKCQQDNGCTQYITIQTTTVNPIKNSGENSYFFQNHQIDLSNPTLKLRYNSKKNTQLNIDYSVPNSLSQPFIFETPMSLTAGRYEQQIQLTYNEEISDLNGKLSTITSNSVVQQQQYSGSKTLQTFSQLNLQDCHNYAILNFKYYFIGVYSVSNQQKQNNQKFSLKIFTQFIEGEQHSAVENSISLSFTRQSPYAYYTYYFLDADEYSQNIEKKRKRALKLQPLSMIYNEGNGIDSYPSDSQPFQVLLQDGYRKMNDKQTVIYPYRGQYLPLQKGGVESEQSTKREIMFTFYATNEAFKGDSVMLNLYQSIYKLITPFERDDQSYILLISLSAFFLFFGMIILYGFLDHLRIKKMNNKNNIKIPSQLLNGNQQEKNKRYQSINYEDK